MLLLERDPLVLTEWPRDVAAAERPGGLPYAPRKRTLLVWAAIVALLHFDRGASTVAALGVLHPPYEHGFSYVVSLLAWHSVGLALGSALAGAAFQKVSAKLLIVLALLVDAAALLVLGVAEVPTLGTFVLRCVSGFAASLPLIFLPSWVDEYSPSEAGAQWIALVQTGAPVGQFLGAAAAAAVTYIPNAQGSRYLDWRCALIFQVILIVPVFLRLLFIPASQVEVSSLSSSRVRLDSLTLCPAEGSQIGTLHAVLREMRESLAGISRNPLTVSLTATLCFLHSTAAGLSLWAAPYLAKSPGAPSELAVMLLVALTFAVCPMVGTYVGAILCDRVQGFKAGHHAAALRIACSFIAIAALAGPLSGSTNSFVTRLLLLGFWMTCVGAFLPISAGMLMTSMPSYLRSFASASSVFLFHLLSFAIVPFVSSMMMSCFDTVYEGLSFGVCCAFWMTVPAAILLVLAYAREPKSGVPTGLSGVDDLTFSDITSELSRRRMSTTPL